MGDGLRVLGALLSAMSSVPSPRVRRFSSTGTPAPGDLTPFVLLEHLHIMGERKRERESESPQEVTESSPHSWPSNLKHLSAVEDKGAVGWLLSSKAFAPGLPTWFSSGPHVMGERPASSCAPLTSSDMHT